MMVSIFLKVQGAIPLSDFYEISYATVAVQNSRQKSNCQRSALSPRVSSAGRI